MALTILINNNNDSINNKNKTNKTKTEYQDWNMYGPHASHTQIPWAI